MKRFQHILHGLQLSRLKKFTALLPKTRIKWSDALAYVSVHRDKVEKLLPPEFCWSFLYELEVKEMVNAGDGAEVCAPIQ